MHVNILAYDPNAEDSQNIRVVGSPGGESLVRADLSKNAATGCWEVCEYRGLP